MQPRVSRSLTLLSLALLPGLGRVRTLYRALGSHNSLCETRRYMNLGYWEDGTDTLDAAAECLAMRVAQTADIGPGDAVLDVGCGFAEHDMLWAARCAPQHLVAVNISPEQLAMAAQMHPDRARAGVRLLVADAVRMPFADACFDAVLGVESAFHFLTRQAFFQEVLRVLKPGGRLALADLCGVDRRLAPKDRLAELIGRSFWQIPKANLVPRAEYAKQLRTTGFTKVSVKSIWHRVYPRFADYARHRLHMPEISTRLSPVFRRMLIASLGARRKLDPEAMDYVLASAHKPATAGTSAC